MKKHLFFLMMLVSITNSYAQKQGTSSMGSQEFQGMAVYESKTSAPDMKSRFSANREITPEMQKTIEERMKKNAGENFYSQFR
jgi:hypothetical protein